MHMKKLLLLSGVLLTLSIITIIIFNNIDNKENNIISNVNKDTEVINSNMITMMYETDAGTGIYEETKDTTWPESGYIFNNTLSGCENGGELEYNSINKTINLLSNSSDRCYVYFDKYDGVWIDNVSVTNVTGSSVTLDISATSENGSITTYYYSLNDNEEYQETTTNPITINDLNTLTEYKISIYAIDSTNARSNIYEVIVSTTDESGPVINSVSVSDITSYGFTLTVDATSDVGIKRYYYIIESENIAGTSVSNTYAFYDLKDNTGYNIIIFVEDNNGLYSEQYSLSVSTTEVIYLANYIKSLYTSQGANGIYYHTSSLANGAGDNSYRYSGANPNNYVCFGSDEEICPEDNLYRIIGVFDDEVKLIKSTSYGGYQLDINGINTWSSSSLNTTLNSVYLVSLDNWAQKIAFYDWKVGGMDHYNGRSTPKTAYDYEVGVESESTTYSARIGLMYVSDYGYGATHESWTTNLSSYRNVTTNWLHFSSSEWTITPHVNFENYSFAVGLSSVEYALVNRYKEVRPCFYLNSNVSYVSGIGSSSDPYRIN